MWKYFAFNTNCRVTSFNQCTICRVTCLNIWYGLHHNVSIWIFIKRVWTLQDRYNTYFMSFYNELFLILSIIFLIPSRYLSCSSYIYAFNLTASVKLTMIRVTVSVSVSVQFFFTCISLWYKVCPFRNLQQSITFLNFLLLLNLKSENYFICINCFEHVLNDKLVSHIWSL